MTPLSHTHGQIDSPNPLKVSWFLRISALIFWPQSFGVIRYVTRFDLYVITFAIGIMAYFALPVELPFWIASIFCLAVGVVIGILRRRSPPYFCRIMIEVTM